jgi:hypothetical protein
MVLLRRVHLNYRASRLYGQAEEALNKAPGTEPETVQLAQSEPIDDQATHAKDSS